MKTTNALIIAEAFLFGAGQAHAVNQVSIGASGSGSGPYLNAGLMADTANKAQKDYKFSVQTTGGYKDNLGLVLTDKVDVALNTLIGIYDAYNQNHYLSDFSSYSQYKKFDKIN